MPLNFLPVDVPCLPVAIFGTSEQGERERGGETERRGNRDIYSEGKRGGERE